MSTRVLPTDQNSFPIQTLGLGDTVATITVGAVSARAAIPSGAGHDDIVRIACNTDCYIRFGDSSVVATSNDSLFTQGVEAFKVRESTTHVAAIQVDTAGVMTLTEMR